MQEFQRVTAHAQRPGNSETGHVGRDSNQIALRDLSGREIEEIADKAARKESLTELNRARVSPCLSLEVTTSMMSRLGIPVSRIAHILCYFSDQNDLVFDPMAGGGVMADTCLALNRKCRSFDMDDRPDTRAEIEPYFWDIANLKWPIKGKTKPDLIVFDPPYFKKQSNNYDPDGIFGPQVFSGQRI